MEIFHDIQSCLSDVFRHQDVNFQIFISYVMQLPGRNVFKQIVLATFCEKLSSVYSILKTYTAKTI